MTDNLVRNTAAIVVRANASHDFLAGSYKSQELFALAVAAIGDLTEAKDVLSQGLTVTNAGISGAAAVEGWFTVVIGGVEGNTKYGAKTVDMTSAGAHTFALDPHIAELAEGAYFHLSDPSGGAGNIKIDSGVWGRKNPA